MAGWIAIFFYTKGFGRCVRTWEFGKGAGYLRCHMVLSRKVLLSNSYHPFITPARTLIFQETFYHHLTLSLFTVSWLTLERSYAEDEILRNEFGDQWTRWAEKVPYALIPYVI